MQDVEHPEVGIIGGYVTGGVQEILHGAVKARIVQYLALAQRETVICYEYHSVVQEHIHKQRTQLLSGFVAAGEELLVESGAYIAGQIDGLVQMIADGVAYHARSPPFQRGIGLIGGYAAGAVVAVALPVAQVAFGYERVAESLVLLYGEFGQQSFEQLYSLGQAVIGIGLLNLGQIDGALEHLAAVSVIGGHIPDLGDYLGRTLGKVLFNVIVHLLPGARILVSAGCYSSQCHNDNQKRYSQKVSHKQSDFWFHLTNV